jgi:HAMP domain-containing protein
MLTFVLIFNLVVACVCFYVASQIWAWRGAMAQTADALIEAERVTHEVLNGAPNGIMQGQLATYEVRQSYRQLDRQLQQLQKVMAILRFFSGFWVGRRPLRL